MRPDYKHWIQAAIGAAVIIGAGLYFDFAGITTSIARFVGAKSPLPQSASDVQAVATPIAKADAAGVVPSTVARTTSLTVGIYSRFDSSGHVIASAGVRPLQGAVVTVAGQQKMTDASGVARFGGLNLPPTPGEPIAIKAAGFRATTYYQGLPVQFNSTHFVFDSSELLV